MRQKITNIEREANEALKGLPMEPIALMYPVLKQIHAQVVKAIQKAEQRGRESYRIKSVIASTWNKFDTRIIASLKYREGLLRANELIQSLSCDGKGPCCGCDVVHSEAIRKETEK